jgi:hypothetical protein
MEAVEVVLQTVGIRAVDTTIRGMVLASKSWQRRVIPVVPAVGGSESGKQREQGMRVTDE